LNDFRAYASSFGIGPDLISITHSKEISLDEKTGNLELSEWIWQNVVKRCAAA
jgi:hypothetical protein